MANALWHVTFNVTLKDREMTELVSLCSPDYVDTRKARRKATATARERLSRKLLKTYKLGSVKRIVCLRCECVG